MKTLYHRHKRYVAAVLLVTVSVFFASCSKKSSSTASGATTVPAPTLPTYQSLSVPPTYSLPPETSGSGGKSRSGGMHRDKAIAIGVGSFLAGGALGWFGHKKWGKKKKEKDVVVVRRQRQVFLEGSTRSTQQGQRSCNSEQAALMGAFELLKEDVEAAKAAAEAAAGDAKAAKAAAEAAAGDAKAAKAAAKAAAPPSAGAAPSPSPGEEAAGARRDRRAAGGDNAGKKRGGQSQDGILGRLKKWLPPSIIPSFPFGPFGSGGRLPGNG